MAKDSAAKNATAENDRLLSVRDVAVRNQLTYRAAYDRILKGLYGAPREINGRLYVSDEDNVRNRRATRQALVSRP